jgi:hypothetical protein
MAVSQIDLAALLKRAGGRCECTQRRCATHRPGIPCGVLLVSGQWEPHRIIMSAGDGPNNLRAMCDACHHVNLRSWAV